ncbi:MAG: TIGR00303 family protein [Methanomicrobiaceae archaeon]|nr:TIGR00303 family protein [Methanomicrobiaceae archaeon]
MPFLSEIPDITFKKPMAAMVIANSMLSAVPGVSAAGANPKATLMTPNLDGKLILNGPDRSAEIPMSPRGCATPATVTRAMFELCEIEPVIVNAGLVTKPDFPCMDVYAKPGEDPRFGDAVEKPEELYKRGVAIGRQWGKYSDLLVLGESVPGGTTTALCVLRALGYNAGVSSSFIENPATLKAEICSETLARIKKDNITDPFDIIRYAGDPMMPVVAGIAKGYKGRVVLSGGTQMLSVCAHIKSVGDKMPPFVTTEYVRADKSADIEKSAREVGATGWYVDPDFKNIGIPSLARYENGEVKEGAVLGGALWLAYMMNFSEREIFEKIRDYMGEFRCKNQTDLA